MEGVQVGLVLGRESLVGLDRRLLFRIGKGHRVRAILHGIPRRRCFVFSTVSVCPWRRVCGREVDNDAKEGENDWQHRESYEFEKVFHVTETSTELAQFKGTKV
jgi:hypothetical protein